MKLKVITICYASSNISDVVALIQSGEKMESMVCKPFTWPAKSRFKTTVNVRKVKATILCNIRSIILVDFMPYSMMVTAAAY
jgi:hypothetical protein